MRLILLIIYPLFTLTKFLLINQSVPPVYKPKRVKGEAKLRVHKTGSARSEGYYKIEMKEKAQYLKSALRQLTVLKQRDDVDQKTAASQVKIENFFCRIVELSIFHVFQTFADYLDCRSTFSTKIIVFGVAFFPRSLTSGIYYTVQYNL